jgi:hypothetical protein
MKQEKQDRRSQRTRRLVNTAMLELLFEKHYDTITVQEILDRAGIGRSTFYTHFSIRRMSLAVSLSRCLKCLASNSLKGRR